MATKKATLNDIKVKESMIEKKSEELTEDMTLKEPKITKTYKDDDTIPCRSICPGELVYVGKKTKNIYIFSNYDDTIEIEVADLNASRASRSQYLLDPLIIIEDEDFLDQPKWKEIKELYNKLKNSDIDKLLNSSLSNFKRMIKDLPTGYKSLLITEMSTRIRNKELDSIGKVRAVDEAFGTELMLLIN